MIKPTFIAFTTEIKCECVKHLITEVEKLAVDFVKDIAGKYADDFQGLKKTLTPDLALKLDTCLTVNTAVNGHS